MNWIRRGWLTCQLVVVAVLAASVGGDTADWDRCGGEPREIFLGIVYGCRQLETTDEGSGLVYWVRVDLKAPGIKLYVTPLDQAAVAGGWQYRLRWIADVVDTEHLAVAINATMFTAKSTWLISLPGDFARGVETVVANHVVSHVWEHTYLLWFDDQLNPHLRPSKPPRPADLAEAKWGIGGQAVWLYDGKVWFGQRSDPECPNSGWYRRTTETAVLGGRPMDLAAALPRDAGGPWGERGNIARRRQLECNRDRAGRQRHPGGGFIWRFAAGGDVFWGPGSTRTQEGLACGCGMPAVVVEFPFCHVGEISRPDR